MNDITAVPGFEDDYLSDSSIEKDFRTPSPAPTYVGKGKQRADPVDEALYDRQHSMINNDQSNNQLNQEIINNQDIQPLNRNEQSDQKDSKDPKDPIVQNDTNDPNDPNDQMVEDMDLNDIMVHDNITIHDTMTPNIKTTHEIITHDEIMKQDNKDNIMVHDIMVPCPLSSIQLYLIKSILTDVELSYYLGQVSMKEKPDIKLSPLIMSINNCLQIINNEFLQKNNEDPLTKFSSSAANCCIGKLRMLEILLKRLKRFPIKIGIAVSTDKSMNTIVSFMTHIRQRYGIIDENSFKDNLRHKSSFCWPKLDVVIVYDSSFESNKKFYYPVHNPKVTILRLTSVNTLEEILIYGTIKKYHYLNTLDYERLLKIFFYGMKCKKGEVTIGVHWKNNDFKETFEEWFKEIGYHEDMLTDDVSEIYKNFNMKINDINLENLSQLKALNFRLSDVDNDQNILTSEIQQKLKRQPEFVDPADSKRLKLGNRSANNEELAKTRMSELQISFEILQRQRDSINKDLLNVQSERDNLKQEVAILQEECTRLKEKLVKYENNQELFRLKDENSKLKKSTVNLKETTLKLKRFEKEIKTLKSDNNLLGDLNAQQSEDIVMLNNCSDVLNNKLSQMQEKLRIKDEQIDMMIKEKTCLTHLSVQQTQEIGRLKSANEIQAQEINALGKQLEEFTFREFQFTRREELFKEREREIFYHREQRDMEYERNRTLSEESNLNFRSTFGNGTSDIMVGSSSLTRNGGVGGVGGGSMVRFSSENEFRCHFQNCNFSFSTHTHTHTHQRRDNHYDDGDVIVLDD
ncbi:875_t:CDS:2 [Diversispora eburnea]|uniref:875_t:CDS:1 n=1 Tax=Diversispora eburnea TaxID=1213867 RepID=A0A9N9FPM1_9GLOM|nr:875_t:CDS:2 [Diversispora eburnea]